MKKSKDRARNKKQNNISGISKNNFVKQDLVQKVMQLLENPGVYLMEDFLGNIIYVGKAKNLKKRVSQYFINVKNRAPKVAEMINNLGLKHILRRQKLIQQSNKNINILAI